MARGTTELLETLFVKCDIQSPQLLEKLPPDIIGKCDKIFSNAALHWCSRDPLSVLANARKILKVGGLFVAEMGGYGNVAGLHFQRGFRVRGPGILTEYSFRCHKCFECRIDQARNRSCGKKPMVLPYAGPIYAIVKISKHASITCCPATTRDAHSRSRGLDSSLLRT